MRLPVEKTGEVLAVWVDQELLPKSSGSLQKAATVLGSLVLAKKAPVKIAENKTMLEFADLLDESGRIRLEELRDLANEMIQRTGKLQIAGIILGQDDIASIYETATRFADE